MHPQPVLGSHYEPRDQEHLSQSPGPLALRVSTTFYPGALLFGSDYCGKGDSDESDYESDDEMMFEHDVFGNPLPENGKPASRMADMVLTTIPESIHFYVHSRLLLKRSSNAFAFLITPPDDISRMSADESISGQGGVDGVSGGRGQASPFSSVVAATSTSNIHSHLPSIAGAPMSTFESSPSFTAMDAAHHPQPSFDGVASASNESIMARHLSGSKGNGTLLATPRAMQPVNASYFSSATLLDPSLGPFPWGSLMPASSQQMASSSYPYPGSMDDFIASQTYSQCTPPAAGNARLSQSRTVSYYQSSAMSSLLLHQQQQHLHEPQQWEVPTSATTSNPPPGPRIFIQLHEKAEVLNLLLHAVYNLNPARYVPSLEALSCLPGTLLNYGFSLDEHLSPDSELTRLYLNYTRSQPVDVYAVAAAYGLEYIAQKASRPSLTTPLTSVTDKQVIMMGSVYLRRLVQLHHNRLEALKKILLTLPTWHGRNNPVACDDTEANAYQVWALAMAYLAWEARPDMSSVELAQVLVPLMDSVSCAVCKNNLQARISSALRSWAQVRDTI